MTITSIIPYIYERLFMFILVFTRISALLSVFILFRRELVNSRIMIALTSILSFYAILFTGAEKAPFEIISLQMLYRVLFQFFIGFISGLILNILFEIFLAAGQIISSQLGLLMASIIDPGFGNITSLSQFYLFTTMLLFMLLNGHLLILKIIIDSFHVIPADQTFIPSVLIKETLAYSSTLFSGALLLSLTIMMTILITNIAFALMVRFAPQFNFFSIGVNLTIILGILFVYLTFIPFVNKATFYIQHGITTMETAIKDTRLYGR